VLAEGANVLGIEPNWLDYLFSHAANRIAPDYAMPGASPKRKIRLRENRVSEFPPLRKDADPDIPILKQAKREYATLK